MLACYQHQPVLLDEAVSGLNIQSNGIYIDGTFGRGGHSRLILSQLGFQGKLLAIDRDPQAVAAATAIKDPRFSIIQGPFSELARYVHDRGWSRKVNGILFDLGVSSPQLEDPNRGFSFLRDGPLDMRMDPSQGQSAAMWLQQAPEEEIAWVLKTFGEERFAKRIARAIIRRQHQTPLLRTAQLAALVAGLLPVREKHKHPATRTFQAIRIYINSELDEITHALEGALDILAPQGWLSVISFHSLEDRLVKHFIRQHSRPPQLPARIPLTQAQLHCYGTPKLIAKGKVMPSDEEIKINPRARSSVLRLAQRRKE